MGSSRQWIHTGICNLWWKFHLWTYYLLFYWDISAVRACSPRKLAHELHGPISNTNKPLFLQKHFICFERQEYKYTLTRLRNCYQISTLWLTNNLLAFHTITSEEQPNPSWLDWVAFANMTRALQRQSILRMLLLYQRVPWECRTSSRR